MDFSGYRLQALRDYARELGINSPTTYKKADLIAEIVNALKNETKSTHTKRGRKVLSNNIEDTSLILGKEYASEINKATQKYLLEIEEITEKYKKIIGKNI